jgi:hypothetical protein
VRIIPQKKILFKVFRQAFIGITIGLL